MSSTFKKIALIAALLGSAGGAIAGDSFNFSSGSPYSSSFSLTFSEDLLNALNLGGATTPQPSYTAPDFLLTPIWTVIDLGGNLSFKPVSLADYGLALSGGSIIGTGGSSPKPSFSYELINVAPGGQINLGTLTPGTLTFLSAATLVPEPANVAMFGLGLLGIGLAARRRRCIAG